MLVIRVELHSAITGRTTEIARMHICNTGGGTAMLADYTGRTLRGRDEVSLDRGAVQREGEVRNHQRLRLHVWHLIAKMLASMGYGAVPAIQRGQR